MAWSWSHTLEAYLEADEKLKSKSRGWLEETLAEIRTYEDCSRVDREQGCLSVCPDDYFDEALFREHRKSVSLLPGDVLADEIWSWAEEWRTCSNGGWALYMCPYGCHEIELES